MWKKLEEQIPERERQQTNRKNDENVTARCHILSLVIVSRGTGAFQVLGEAWPNAVGAVPQMLDPIYKLPARSTATPVGKHSAVFVAGPPSPAEPRPTFPLPATVLILPEVSTLRTR